MKRAIGIVVLGVVFAAAAVPALAHIVSLLDQAAPALSCTKWWNGPPPDVTKRRGVVTVIHFADPSQVTSKAFQAKVRALHDANAGKPFSLIEIAVNCKEAEVSGYVSSKEVPWPVGHDGGSATSSAYPGNSVPRTYLVGPDGLVAWHGHITALDETLLLAQYERVAFFDGSKIPRRAKDLVKQASKFAYGLAMEEVRKIREDKYADQEERRLADVVERDVRRYFELQWKVLEAAEKEFDWGVAWDRIEVMKRVYAGTEYEARVNAKWQSLADNPRVKINVEGEEILARIIRKTNLRKKKDLESAIRELQQFEKDYQNLRPAAHAKQWREEFERMLREGLD